MEIKHVNSNEFEAEVLKSDKKVLVDFWANWCGPCKMLAPVLEQVAEEMPDVQIVKVDVDDNGDLAEKYNVMSIPTMILFKNGEQVGKSVGFIGPDQVKDFINQY